MLPWSLASGALIYPYAKKRSATREARRETSLWRVAADSNRNTVQKMTFLPIQ
jgi:hypothetical protein